MTVSVYVIEAPFRTGPVGSFALVIETSGSVATSFQQNAR